MKRILAWEKIVACIRYLLGKNTRRTGVGLLQLLEKYPDKKGTTMWKRTVKTIIAIAYLDPKSFFNPPETFPQTLEKSKKTPHGLLLDVPSSEYAKKMTFLGFAGNNQTSQYSIKVTLSVDSDRQRPVFIYTFEVFLGSSHRLCGIAAIFQDKNQTDETKSHQETSQADLVYRGAMAMGLARVFHELTSYPIPTQVAATLGIFGNSAKHQYRC